MRHGWRTALHDADTYDADVVGHRFSGAGARCGQCCGWGIVMKKILIALTLVGSAAAAAAQQNPNAVPKVPPMVDQVLSLKRVAAPEISPDGRSVAYTVRETNWEDNAYETEIWVADT